MCVDNSGMATKEVRELTGVLQTVCYMLILHQYGLLYVNACISCSTPQYEIVPTA
jgi:hypothetical protein